MSKTLQKSSLRGLLTFLELTNSATSPLEELAAVAAVKRGGSITDKSIEDSEFYALIKQTFSELTLPAGLCGSVIVRQRETNRDDFEFIFTSTTDFDPYRVNGKYSAPDLSVIKRGDFDHFPKTEGQCRNLLEGFVTRLAAGKLIATARP